MKWLAENRIKLGLVGFVAAVVLRCGSVKADFTFGAPVHVGPPISSPYGEGVSCITADGLEMYLTINRKPGGLGIWDIWVSKRETVNDDWGEPENLGAPINTSQSDSNAHLLPDGLEMYFTAYNRSGGYGHCDTWVTRRATRNDPWAGPENLGPLVNTSSFDHFPRISPDGLELYFSSTRPGGYGAEDIYVTKRATKNDPWGAPVNLGPPVNTSASENFPSISSDGLLLIFSGYPDTVGWHRPGGYGSADIWAARRASVSDAWGTPVNLGPMVNSAYIDGGAILSPDGQTLYFSSARPGGLGGTYGDIYQSPIIPIVDFNGDETVDVQDVMIMTEHWGENYPLCDIGPMPWGDGIVDVLDLIVLTEHMEPIIDHTLKAHWTLDETEGLFAVDSAGDNDAVVLGGIEWQPTGGQIDGAIELDGVSGYAVAGAVLNPVDGPFSVLAWINGGAPGQVVVSQQLASNWLSIDTDGNLITELKCTGRSAGPLYSETFITDGQWHRIGLVWDGSNRTLYVDDVAVAEDIQPGLQGSQMGLYIGTGKAMEPGTYFSGLIDDVRIYNRALNAGEIAALAK